MTVEQYLIRRRALNAAKRCGWWGWHSSIVYTVTTHMIGWSRQLSQWFRADCTPAKVKSPLHLVGAPIIDSYRAERSYHLALARAGL